MRYIVPLACFRNSSLTHMHRLSRRDFSSFVLIKKKLRADLYRGLADAAIHGADLHEVGSPIILPSTFIGATRQMWTRWLFHDAMAIVRLVANRIYSSP